MKEKIQLPKNQPVATIPFQNTSSQVDANIANPPGQVLV